MYLYTSTRVAHVDTPPTTFGCINEYTVAHAYVHTHSHTCHTVEPEQSLYCTLHGVLSDSVPKTHDIVSPSILVFLDKEHYVVILDVHVYTYAHSGHTHIL